MKISEQSIESSQACREALPRSPEAVVATKEKLSLSKMAASTFGKFDVARRARLLARLLASVGPLALKVVSGGVFAKYVRHARSPEIPVSLEDAARATSSQVRDLARYVEQSDPSQVEELLTALSQEEGEIAAPAIKRRSDRRPALV
jgi:hypothetical protein